MNEKFKAIASKHGVVFSRDGYGEFASLPEGGRSMECLNAVFKEIASECVTLAHGVASLRDATDDMVYGADTAAARISKHFGLRDEE